MLRELNIRNLAIIENLDIELDHGFNVLTGETGAGKSIIVDALGLTIGSRAQSDLIKSGKKECVVSAAFEVADNTLLHDLGIDMEEGIIVRRVVSASGKNKAYVNDTTVNTRTIIDLGASLVDIHSQHENQSLLLKEKQLTLLDLFGKLEGETKKYASILKKYNSLIKEKESLDKDIDLRNQKVDLLRFQVEEIESASLEPNEKEELLKEYGILSNMTLIKELSESSYNTLYAMDNSVNDLAAGVYDNLNRLSKLDPTIEESLHMAAQIHSFVKELSHLLRIYKDEIVFSDERLEVVENRLETIKRLEGKYGDGIENILQHKSDAKAELEELLNSEEKLGSLALDISAFEERLIKDGEKLSQKRARAAEKLEKDVMKVLKELSFDKAGFKVNIQKSKNSDDSLRYNSTGIDIIEFLFSANPGEPLKPIHKVASGGELSRIMLALKSVFAEYDDIPVLIFDEVDTGIGGKTAEMVGRRLKNIAERHQVLCITHLPQIASMADNHIKISKNVSDKDVTIRVEKLTYSQREGELARMLGGNVTEISLRHARELLHKHL